ncbi:hypothetical protein LTS10_001036 [Elasticomyces elasticus]|nr:hypothetical protein LTS10_001036 [Elasticomyces elasticus]
MPVKGKKNRSSKAISETAQLSAPDSKFHKSLQERAGPIPRFFFRAWSSASGGDPRLNTTNAITPHAFVGGGGPASIRELSAKQIRLLWKGHYQGAVVNSVLSSWSQSWLASASVHGTADGYLSILDTTRLKEHNFVAQTARCCKLGLIGDDYEYYIFGIVSGEAYNSVPLGKIPGLKVVQWAGAGKWSRLILTHDGVHDETQAVAASTQCSALFGPAFELAMICYFLTSWYGSTSQPSAAAIAKLASEHDVPKEWLGDTVLNFDDLGGCPIATTAAIMMKAIAEEKYGFPRSEGMWEQAINAREAHRTLVGGCPPNDYVLGVEPSAGESSHPSMVIAKPAAKLAIDMVGWDWKSLMGHGYSHLLVAASSPTSDEINGASPT